MATHRNWENRIAATLLRAPCEWPVQLVAAPMTHAAGAEADAPCRSSSAFPAKAKAKATAPGCPFHNGPALYRLYLDYIQSSRKIPMRYSSQVKPISYLKAHAAEVLASLGAQREPLVITQNGEAKAVLQDVASYEATQETLALLKVLALGSQEVAAGKVKPVDEVIARLKAKRARA